MDTDGLKTFAAFSSPFIVVLGWIVVHFLSKRREDRTRCSELVLTRISDQIEKLYGPLLSRIEQIHTTWEVKERIVNSTEVNNKEDVLGFIKNEHFFPLHQEIRNIISENMHLLEGREIPKSFRLFLEHSTQQVVKKQLEKEFSLELSNVKYVPWPKEFPKDVSYTLNELMNRYEQHLKDLDTVKKFG